MSAPPTLQEPDRRGVLRVGVWSFVVARRSLVVCAVLGGVVFAVVVAACSVGSTGVDPVRAGKALLGIGDPLDVMLVRDIRLPRVVAALLCGGALGAAGCLTQTLSGNRLATPDLLGVSGGATAAVLLAATGAGAAQAGDWWLGPAGAAGAAALVVLAAGGLGPRGYRVLVVGLGLSTVMNALTDLAVSRQNLQSAGGLFVWAMGSLGGRGWPTAGPAGICLAALLPVALYAGRRLAVLRFDDDTAAALGADLRRTRLLALAAAVALAGVAAGIAGPVGFLAMAAPIVAAKLTGPASPVPVLPSALLGAALAAAADALGRAAGPVEIPVGVVTSVLGGPFLLWVLFGGGAAPRRRAAGRSA